jgi:hypothetical protein
MGRDEWDTPREVERDEWDTGTAVAADKPLPEWENWDPLAQVRFKPTIPHAMRPGHAC